MIGRLHASQPAILSFAIGTLLMVSCKTSSEGAIRSEEETSRSAPNVKVGAPADPLFQLPRGLESLSMVVPPESPLTMSRITLGQQLFFDKRLSATGQMSCESCHVPEKGWTDGLALSPKFDGSINTRHSPTMYGVGFYPELYWDGRSKGLNNQVLAAWKGQMGGKPDEVASALAAVPGYATQFEAIYGGVPTGERVADALATFLRSVQAGDTPWDRLAADPTALETSDIGKGFKVFRDVARCAVCHLPPLFTDTTFHNIGVGYDRTAPDLGRGKFLADAATKNNQPKPEEADRMMGAFKTPSLRGIAITGPYFHDGRAKTLDEAVDLMLKGGIANANLDPLLQSVTLTEEQRIQLMAFLRSLTPEHKSYARPSLP